MNRLKLLQIKKLFKELDYIESDYDYRNELVTESDSEFLNGLDIFLNNHPELKELYEYKLSELEPELEPQIINESFSFDQFNFDTTNNLEIEPEPIYIRDKSPKVKKLYREIVKLTHPDKSDNKSYNDLYLKATDYYDKNNKIGICKICNQMGLEYLFDDELNIDVEIEDEIKSIKNKINFIESTLTYQWFISDDNSHKDRLLLKYIESKLY